MDSLTITPERISNTYDALKLAISAAHNADEFLLTARQDIATKGAGLVLAGKLTGKNETERDAQKREQLAAEYVRLSEAERAQRAASAYLELARIDVEQLRMELRLAELRATPSIPAGDALTIK